MQLSITLFLTLRRLPKTKNIFSLSLKNSKSRIKCFKAYIPFKTTQQWFGNYSLTIHRIEFWCSIPPYYNYREREWETLKRFCKLSNISFRNKSKKQNLYSSTIITRKLWVLLTYAGLRNDRNLRMDSVLNNVVL